MQRALQLCDILPQNPEPLSHHEETSKIPTLRDVLQNSLAIFFKKCQDHEKKGKIEKLFQIGGD